MNETKSVNSLKRQMTAAIAMVLVAGIALASATYAWFVTNNKVDATTTNISAQSKSAYLVIDTKKTTKDSISSVSAGDTVTPLYPAKIEKSSGNALWKSAYADKANVATMKAGTEFTIDDGTAEKAVSAGYAVKNTFYIGTGTYDGEFTNLQVWSAAGEKLSSSESTGTAFTTGVKKDQDATIDVYVYYDGDDANVYSDNLTNLTSNGVTITFEATPKEYKSTPTA